MDGGRGREGGKHSASLFALLLKLCSCVYFPLDLLKQFSLLFTQYTCLATRVRVRVCACTCVYLVYVNTHLTFCYIFCANKQLQQLLAYALSSASGHLSSSLSSSTSSCPCTAVIASETETNLCNTQRKSSKEADEKTFLIKIDSIKPVLCICYLPMQKTRYNSASLSPSLSHYLTLSFQFKFQQTIRKCNCKSKQFVVLEKL